METNKVNNFLNKFFYLYRGYGYFSNGQHLLALQDYTKSIKYSLDKYQNYNKLICSAIISLPNQGIKPFYDIVELFPNKLEPNLYISLILFTIEWKKIRGSEISTKIQVVRSCEERLD